MLHYDIIETLMIDDTKFVILEGEIIIIIWRDVY